MIHYEHAQCPECGCKVQSRAAICCDDCAEKRRQAQRERDKLSKNVGRTSSPDSFELNEAIVGDRQATNADVRSHIGLRSDAKWHIGKHGAG